MAIKLIMTDIMIDINSCIFYEENLTSVEASSSIHLASLVVILISMCPFVPAIHKYLSFILVANHLYELHPLRGPTFFLHFYVFSYLIIIIVPYITLFMISFILFAISLYDSLMVFFVCLLVSLFSY